MRLYFIKLMLLYANVSFASTWLDLESGIGSGKSNSSSYVKRADFFKLKFSSDYYSSETLINWYPVLAIEESQKTFFSNQDNFISMMKHQETLLGLGVRGKLALKDFFMVTDVLAERGSGVLRINRSSPSSTSIAQIDKVPSHGYSLSVRGEFVMSKPINLVVGLQFRHSRAKIKDFAYNYTSAVKSGLSLAQQSTGRNDLEVSSEMKTSTTALVLGVNISL